MFSHCSFNPILIEVVAILYFGLQSIQQLRLETLLWKIMYRETYKLHSLQCIIRLIPSDNQSSIDRLTPHWNWSSSFRFTFLSQSVVHQSFYQFFLPLIAIWILIRRWVFILKHEIWWWNVIRILNIIKFTLLKPLCEMTL